MTKTNLRAAIASLTLINFNGIQFEHLQFDDTTTSLEGRNGAGKTTTMIGSYLPLMPDQAFLKFKNVSDSADQAKYDGGIYDRFGIYSDTAYSVMEFRLSDGTSFYAGVEVQKRPQRKYELTPFIIRDVPNGLPPEDLLMVQDAEGQHCITQLSQLSTHIVSLGAYIKKFAKLSDYFHALFENGVSPTLMTTMSDRSKFHKLMMASFYGGLTGDLQKSIKDYLLPENNDVATAVERARTLLNEVRLTKQTIERAQEAYGKVQKIDTSAFELIATAYYSIRNQLESSKKEMLKLREAYRTGKVVYRQLVANVKRLGEEEAHTKADLKKAEATRKAAEEHFQGVKEAHQLACQIDQLRPVVDELMRTHDMATAAYQQAVKAHETAYASYRTLLTEQKELARTLGDARQAFEEISRKVGLYNAATRALKEVQACLSDQSVTPDNAQVVREQQERARREARTALEPARRRLQNAEDMQKAFMPVHAALEMLHGHPVAPANAFAVGTRVLAVYREMEAVVKAAEGIEERIRDAVKNAKRQAALRDQLAKLARDGLSIRSADELIAAINNVLQRLKEQKDLLELEQERLRENKQALHEKTILIKTLREDRSHWTSAMQLRDSLANLSGHAVSNAAELRQESMRLQDASKASQRTIDQLSASIDATAERMNEIQDNGSRLDERLSKLADKLGGKLVSEFYDDVELAAAARLEASMGPLVEAIMVPNIRRAATTLANNTQKLEGVWLVQDEDVSELPQGEFINDVCMVALGNATRVSPIPDHPILGRAARQAEIQRLQAEIDDGLAARTAEEGNLRLLMQQLAIIDDLRPLEKWLDRESPEAMLSVAENDVQQTERHIVSSTRRIAAAKAAIATQEALHGKLNECNLNAAFIEGEDWPQVVDGLQEQKKQAVAYQRKIAADHTSLATLQEGLETLRAIPLTDAELASLRSACDELEARIVHGNDAIDKLNDLLRQLRYFAYADQVQLEAKERGALQQLAETENAIAQKVEEADTIMQGTDAARSAADMHKSQTFNAWDAQSKWMRQLEARLDKMDRPSDDASLQLAQEALISAQAGWAELETKNETLLRQYGAEESRRDAQYLTLAGNDNAQNNLVQARNATRVYVRLATDWREFLASVQQDDYSLYERLREPGVVAEYQTQSYVTLGSMLGKLRQQLQLVLAECNAASVLSAEHAARSSRDYLKDWMLVRHYLEQSLPRDITQTDNIQQALRDITVALQQMREKQHEQEGKFRTSAESISNSISNLVRREILNINRINSDKKLADVHFGSITGVHIEATRVEHMTRFLEALRIEQDLFSDDRSLEQALSFVYERSGGGSVNGMHLLDYRKYIQVSIQVKRLGQAHWDSNIGTSSGEAIGVGAAILVVILDAMERQAEALQRRKIKGSIRYLMLDEANRLDSDSLEMMASFCQSMGVQLLVAAPEIAKARTGTTYCFVRRSTPQGQEVEVTYRGRRGFRVGARA